MCASNQCAVRQLPLLELCKKNPPGSPLPLEEMQALLVEELKIAGAAARGDFTPKAGQVEAP